MNLTLLIELFVLNVKILWKKMKCNNQKLKMKFKNFKRFNNAHKNKFKIAQNIMHCILMLIMIKMKEPKFNNSIKSNLKIGFVKNVIS